MDIVFLKNAFLLLAVYACFMSVLVVAYFASLRELSAELFSNFNRSQRFLIALAGGLVVSVVALFMVLYCLDITVDTNLGQIGDFIGGILNPLLSFTAFIAVLVSIGLQERELSSSIDTLRSQEEVLKKQAFESSFYNLLAMMRQRRAEHTISDANGAQIKVYKSKAVGIYKYHKVLSGRGLSPLRQHAMAKKFLTKHMNNSACILLKRQFTMVRGAIVDADLKAKKRSYYYKLFFDDLDPYERVVLTNSSMSSREARKGIRKYKLTTLGHGWVLSDLARAYYMKEGRA